MNFHSACTPRYALLISLLLLTACSRPSNKKLTEARPGESVDRVQDSLALEEQASSPVYADGLFFIEGQLCQHVRIIFQDSRGDLWFGTNVYGLMHYDGDSLRYYDEKDGLGRGRITGIVEDAQGDVWFGTYGGLSRYDGQSFSNFSIQEGTIDNNIWSLIIDKQGLFWIGTLEGVVQFDGESFTPFPIPQAAVKDPRPILSGNRISSILEDQNGKLWFGTDGYGLCKYDPSASPASGDKVFTHFTKEEGLSDHNVYGLMEDREGNIWIGTMYGGVSKYDGKAFTNFTQDSLIVGVEVGGFFEDTNGDIWFAAENAGVYRYDGTSFTNLYTEAGLQTNGILSILKDKEGRFWFGGWGGLFRLKGESFVSVTKEGPWAQ